MIHDVPQAARPVIRIEMSAEAYTHKYRRIIILKQNSYGLDVSDDGLHWKRRETITMGKPLPLQIHPGDSQELQ